MHRRFLIILSLNIIYGPLAISIPIESTSESDSLLADFRAIALMETADLLTVPVVGSIGFERQLADFSMIAGVDGSSLLLPPGVDRGGEGYVDLAGSYWSGRAGDSKAAFIGGDSPIPQRLAPAPTVPALFGFGFVLFLMVLRRHTRRR